MDQDKLLQEWEVMNNVKESIRGKFPKIDFPDVSLAPASFGRREQTFVPGQLAIVGKTKEGKDVHYGWCSENYKLVPHEYVVDRLLTATKELKGFGKPKVGTINVFDPTKDASRPGARILVKVDFPDSVREFKGRRVCPTVAAKSSYDLGWDFNLSFRAIDQVCTNGLIAYKIMQELKARHRNALDIEGMLGELSEGMSQYETQVGTWENWSKIDLNTRQFERVWGDLPFGNRYKDSIMNLNITGVNQSLADMVREGSINAYYLYAGITQFLTHEVESVVSQEDYQEDVAKVLTKALG